MSLVVVLLSLVFVYLLVWYLALLADRRHAADAVARFDAQVANIEWGKQMHRQLAALRAELDAHEADRVNP